MTEPSNDWIDTQEIRRRVSNLSADSMTPGLSYYMKRDYTVCDYCNKKVLCAMLPFTHGTFTRFCAVCFFTWMGEHI